MSGSPTAREAALPASTVKGKTAALFLEGAAGADCQNGGDADKDVILVSADRSNLPEDTRAAAAAKYRHPENAALTWSGRGRKPQWFADHINAGKDPSVLAV